MSALPAVCVVIPTRNRPALLARAVQSVLDQDYGGDLRVVVVLDRAEPDALRDLPDSPHVDVLTNERTPGLSGARNTGVLAAPEPLVAFCDDDDEWLPGKLSAQVAALTAEPGATFASCSIEVDFDGRRNVRLAGADRVTYADLLPSRMAMLHSSTFLIDRAALIDIGLVDEHAPGSQNEDWDLLLRAARQRPIVHVDEPLVRVHWSARSYFSRDWETKISSLEWMLDRHPDIKTSAVGAARVYGQIAFGHAAAGARREAWRWSMRAIRTRWREPRAYLALAAAGGVSADWVLAQLHRRGRGV